MFNKIKHYGVIGCYKLFLSLIYTKVFHPTAKLIRLPIDIRGMHNIYFGCGFVSGFNCRIETYNVGKIFFGKNCQINDYVHIAANSSIIIGDDCLIASKVFISDLNHGFYSGEKQSNPIDICSKRELDSNPIVIGNNVWIGESCSILPGVNIGKNVIIGANSVVTKSFQDNVIIAGNPAIIIKKWNEIKNEWDKVN